MYTQNNNLTHTDTKINEFKASNEGRKKVTANTADDAFVLSLGWFQST
jgi:hypothetical protein